MAEKFSQFTSGDQMRQNDISVGLRSGSNTQFDFPGTGIANSSGQKILGWTSGGDASANYLNFTSGTMGISPIFSATGNDDVVGIIKLHAQEACRNDNVPM